MFLLFLVSLENVEELLVDVGVISVGRLDLVQVMDGMVEFARGLDIDWIPVVAEVSQNRSSGGGLRILEAGGVGWVVRRLLVVTMGSMGARRDSLGESRGIGM